METPLSPRELSSQQIRRVRMTLSKILRHQAPQLKLNISPEGYVLIDDLLKLPSLKGVTRELIDHIVESNSKKRFTIDGDRIRANQGHSFELESPVLTRIDLTNMDQYPIVCHGTYAKYLPSIVEKGLLKMDRTHIHFAKGLPKDEGVISGMRSSCDTIIFLDLKKALEDPDNHLEFFESSNGVILCEGPIPAKYFSAVVNRTK